MVEDAAKHEAEDKARKEAIEARNQLDTLVYGTQKLVQENAAKLADAEKLMIEEELKAAEEVLERNRDGGHAGRAARGVREAAGGGAQARRGDVQAGRRRAGGAGRAASAGGGGGGGRRTTSSTPSSRTSRSVGARGVAGTHDATGRAAARPVRRFGEAAGRAYWSGRAPPRRRPRAARRLRRARRGQRRDEHLGRAPEPRPDRRRRRGCRTAARASSRARCGRRAAIATAPTSWSTC